MKKVGWSSILFVVVLLAVAGIAEPQQLTKIPRIGFLGATSPAALAARVQAFRQGLHELGYVEGKNIVLEYRWAEGRNERLPDLAAELVRLKVDVIVTAGPMDNRAAKEATNTIPIVMAQDNDPVGNRLVASLGRPGGNITGLATLTPELSGKRLEILKEIVPRLSRVAVLGTSIQPGNAQALRETELAAGALAVQLQYLEVGGPEDIETAFRGASKRRAEAILLLASYVFNIHRIQTLDLALKSRLPAIYRTSEFVEDGGLLSYGVNIAELYRRAATYVDKILKGAKPADLPVEQPTKFELVVNLKTAKQMGLTIPPNVLVRADRVIK